MEEVRGHFRPEFINRLDDIVFFEALRPEDLRQIVDIQLERLRHMLSDRHIQLDLTQEAKEMLGTLGYDPVYGARPLKRVIRKYVENPLANALLKGAFRDGDQILATLDSEHPEQLTFTTQPATANPPDGTATPSSLKAGLS